MTSSERPTQPIRIPRANLVKLRCPCCSVEFHAALDNDRELIECSSCESWLVTRADIDGLSVETAPPRTEF